MGDATKESKGDGDDSYSNEEEPVEPHDVSSWHHRADQSWSEYAHAQATGETEATDLYFYQLMCLSMARDDTTVRRGVNGRNELRG